MKINQFYASAIGAFLIWGFFPIPLKALAEYNSGQILYFRIIFSCISLLLITGFFRRKSLSESIRVFDKSGRSEKKKFVLLISAGGVLLTINWLSFIYAINHISIQTGSFSYLICPIITAMLGYFLLKEELSVNQWLAILLSGISCVLLGTGSIFNLGFSLIIATSYAFYLITQRVLKSFDKIFLLLLQLIIATLIIVPFYSVLNADGLGSTNWYFYCVVFIISILFTVIPLFLSLYALKELSSGTMGILMYINPILNFVLAFVMFQEKASLNHIMAYSLISVSIVLYNLKKKRLKVAA